MRFCIETLGCKVNQFETQALETILTARGHTSCSPGSGCDAAIVNTCAVTAESGRKSRQAIRRLKKLEPGAVIGVCGCFSQVSPEEIEDLGADLVGGSGDRAGFADALEKLVAAKMKETADGGAQTSERLLDDPRVRSAFEELPAGTVAGRTRAMLKIQDGCQNFCTYCIIPYARGPVRSLPLDKLREEAQRLGSEGYGEIVLTGIEISSYGRDLPGSVTLLDAVRETSAAAPNARLRLGSLEPRTITEDFCAGLKSLGNVCPHFHLSLQSGCDETLARMKRRYTTAGFLEAVRLLRRTFPDCGITADLIVGFPGETENEFEATLSFIKECAFSSMHIFPYSKRPGTPAAVMPGQLDKAFKAERAHRASEAAREMSREFARRCTGTELEVLFEREKDGVSTGHAGNYLEVSVPGTGLRNTVRRVGILYEKNAQLYGEIRNP